MRLRGPSFVTVLGLGLCWAGFVLGLGLPRLLRRPTARGAHAHPGGGAIGTTFGPRERLPAAAVAVGPPFLPLVWAIARPRRSSDRPIAPPRRRHERASPAGPANRHRFEPRTRFVNRSAAVVFLLLAVAAPTAAAQARSARAVSTREPIAVPAAGPIPVLLDGRLSDGEWDDARSVPIADSMRLLVKQAAGHVFLAVATGERVPRPIDLYVQGSDGVIHQLHASMQIGERLLRDTLWADTLPAWHWGNHVDWIANEAKLDGRQPQSATWSARLFPADATEFQIRRSRFAGREWRVRLELHAFPGTEGSVVYPRDASRDPATWAVLRLD